jgi:hypothetical protein
MLRTTTLSAAALLGLTLLAPAGAATAAVTCQGQVATVTGPGDAYGVLTGTEGDDVIVTDGVEYVDALGGNDLICITGGSVVDLDAGTGDDSVDATLFGSTTDLGHGSDRYVGSTDRDQVAAGSGPYRQDAERDVIDTGPRGEYEDYVWSGHEGDGNSDDVRMGWGSLYWSGPATTTSSVDGGAESVLLYSPETGRVRIDNTVGTLTAGSQPVLRIPGFTRFYVGYEPGLKEVVFRGSSLDEVVGVGFGRTLVRSKIDLRGGDDELQLTSRKEVRGSSYKAGRGHDFLNLSSGTDDLDLDLRRGRLSTGSGKKEITLPATGFEDVQLKARDIELVGTDGPNDIELHGCALHVQARGGKDDISTFIQGPDAGPIICRERRLTVDGGRGNDTMVGTNGRDRLIGGPGRDTADGRQRRDTCRAEVRTSCEVRR